MTADFAALIIFRGNSGRFLVIFRNLNLPRMRKILLLFCFLITAMTAFPQDFLGIINSNYIGVTGIDLQPASIVDSRFKTDITFMGVTANAYNNYIGLKPSALKHTGGLFRGNYQAFNDTAFQDNYLYERENNLRKSVYVTNQVSLPSFLINIDRKSALAFNWRIRNYVNVDGIEPRAGQTHL